MFGTLTILAGLATWPEGSTPRPAVSPAAFRAWFEAAHSGDLAIPDEVERNARRFRYVFVGGFASERMSGYFKDNVAELRPRGVPPGAIHYVYPSSHRTIDENAAEVRERFLAASREGPERLVVIAHSRGACECSGSAALYSRAARAASWRARSNRCSHRRSSRPGNSEASSAPARVASPV
jgi:hypothetical protein